MKNSFRCNILGLFRFLGCLTAAVALNACAHQETALSSMPGASPYQTITINTPGERGVNCLVQSGNESYTVIAPGPVTVRRQPSPMTVSCFKGDHMRGTQSVRAIYAPREANAIRQTGSACYTCAYPNTITIAMAINTGSLSVNLRQWP